MNVKDSGGAVIDPATEQTLASVLSVLQDIDTNTDGLEVTLGDVEINTDNVENLLTTLNGQTDQLESLLTNLDGKDYATETTLATILTEATWTTRMGEVSITPTANTVLGRLKDITDNLQSVIDNTDTLEVNTDEIEGKLDTIGSKLDALGSKLDTLIGTDFATETTLSGLRTDFNNEDFATQTTLSSLLTKVTELDTAFDNEDFAQEATLDLVHTILNDVHDDAGNQLRVSLENSTIEVDVGPDEPDDGAVAGGSTDTPRRLTLSYVWHPDNLQWERLEARGPLATEAKQDATISELQDIEADLESIDGKDFATETTLNALIDEVDALEEELGASTDLEATGDGSLIAITKRIRTLLGNLDGKDFATETTLSQLKDELDNVEEALGDPTDLEATGDGSQIAILKRMRTLLGNLDGKDFATETTLSSVLGQLDITLSSFRDALQGAGGKDFTTIETDLESILGQLDVALSSRATETTLNSVLTQLDVALSTRASETTLSSIDTVLNDVWNDLDDRLRVEVDAIDVEVDVGPDEADDGVVAGGSTDTPKRLTLTYVWDPNAGNWTRLETTGPLATEAKQDNVITQVTGINTAMDVSLSSRASESTLSDAKGVLDTIDADIGDATDVEATGDGSVIAILKRIRTILGVIDANTDGLEGIDYATETSLTTLIGEVDALEESLGSTTDAEATGDGSLIAITKRIRTVLNNIDTQTDDVATETTLADLNTAIGDSTDTSTIPGGAGSVHAKLRKVTSQLNDITNELQDIDANTDTLETKLQSIIDQTDTVETLLGNIDSQTDDVATNTTLVEVRDHLDTVETKLQTLINQTDELEGNTDQLETKLGTIDTSVNTLDDNLDTQLTVGNLDEGLVGHWEFNERGGNVGGELVDNRGFETYTTSPGVPDNWTVAGEATSDGTNGVTREVDTTTVLSGVNSLKVTVDWNVAPTGVNGVKQTITGLQSNASYYFEGWFYHEQDAGAGSVAVLKLRNTTDSVDVASATQPPTGQWVKFSGTFYVDNDSDSYQIEIGAFASSSFVGTDIIYFDNFRVQQIVARDSSPEGNDLTFRGIDPNGQGPDIGLPSFRADLGTAFEFDGDEQKLVNTDPSEALRKIQDTDKTFEVWVNPDAVSGMSLIAGNAADGFGQGWDFGLKDGNIYLLLTDTDAGFKETKTSTAAVPTGSWSHIAAVYTEESNQVRFYINGALDSTHTYTTVLNPRSAAGADLRIGAEDVSGAQPSEAAYDGKMDTLRVYNKALSSDEVALRFDTNDPRHTIRSLLEEPHDELYKSQDDLLDGESVQTPWLKIADYVSISQNFNFDQAIDVVFEYAMDASGTRNVIGDLQTFTFEPPTPGFFTSRHTIQNPRQDYFRITVTNNSGTDITGDFLLLVRGFKMAQQINVLPLDSDVNDFTPTITTRSVLTGKRLDGSYDFQDLNFHARDPNQSQGSALTNDPTKTGSFTVDTGSDLLLDGSNNLEDGDAVVLTTTGTLPDGLDALDGDGNEVVYWVINRTASDFQLATDPEGTSPVDITDSGTGIHSYEERGQFVGTFTLNEQFGSMLSFGLATTDLALVQLEWSDDGTNKIQGLLGQTAFTIEQVEAQGTTFTAGIEVSNFFLAPYHRLRVVNGTDDQTVFSAETLIMPNEFPGTVDSLQANITPLTTALVTRSILAGKQEDGSFGNARLTRDGALKTQIENSPATQSGSLFTEGIRDDINIDWSQDDPSTVLDDLSSGGTVSVISAEGQVGFNTGTTGGNTAIFESIDLAQYDAGHEVRAEFTMEVFQEPTDASSSAYLGILGANNGFAFGYNGTQFGILHRRGGSDTFVPQDDWNVDRCQGQVDSNFRNEGSEQALDPTKANLYRIRYEWLGAAPIYFDVKSPDGLWVNVHTIRYPNNNTGSSITETDLPIRVELDNTGSTTDIEVRSGSWHCGLITSQFDLPWERIFQDSSTISGSLPSGATPSFDKVGPIDAPNVVDTGWISVKRFKDQFFHAGFDIAGVKVFLMDSADDQGTNSITQDFSTPTATSVGAGGAINIGATFFQNYFRVVIINDTGSTANEWSARSMGGDTSPSPVYQGIDQEILDFIPAPIQQAIIKAKNPDGTFDAIEATEFGDLRVGYDAPEIASNSTTGESLDAYAGTPFLDEDDPESVVGSALPGAPSDTYVGSQWESIKDFASFSVDAKVDRLSKGYAIFSADGGSTVSYFASTDFQGVGQFTIPPQGATHFRIAVQNRDTAGSATLDVNTILRYQAQQPFMLPAKAVIDGSFPAMAVKSVQTGSDPSGTFGDVRISGQDLTNRSTTPLTNGAASNFTADFNTNELTTTSHGLSDGDIIVMSSTGELPIPLEEDHPYLVTQAAPDTFKVIDIEDEAIGTVVELRNNGSGTHSWKEPGIFRGSWFEWEGEYNKVVSTFKSDVNGTHMLDMSQAETPADGVDDDVDFSFISTYDTEENPVGRRETPVQSRFYRQRYINGFSNQTEFEMDAILLTQDPGLVTVPLNIPIRENNLAGVVRSVGTGLDANGNFSDLRSSSRSDLNSTSDPLNGDTGGSDHIFRGKWFQWQGGYTKMIVDMRADVEGTLFIDFSGDRDPTDGDESDVDESVQIDYDPADGLISRRVTVRSRFARVRYENGPTAQSSFDLDVAFYTTDVSGDTKTLDTPLVDEDLASTTAAVDISEREEVTGEYVNVKTTRNASGKDGKHVHITGVESDFELGGLENVEMNTFVVNADNTTRIDVPDPGGRRAVEVVNSGQFHAFVKANDSGVTELNGRPLFLGGSANYILEDGEQLWALCEDTGGATQLNDLSSTGNTAGGTATNPDNAKVSNDQRAIQDAVGETLTMEDFTFSHTGGFDQIDRVRIIKEARKSLTPASQTITFQEVQTGFTTGATSVASASLAGGTDQVYIAYVARNATNTVSSVSGGGIDFTSVETQVENNGNGLMLDVWYGSGDFTAGAVTAQMSSSARAEISVIRVSGAKVSDPIRDSNSSFGNTATPTTSSISKISNGMILFGTAHRGSNGTAGTGYTERSDRGNGTGSNRVHLATETKATTSTGTEAPTYNITAGPENWAAISISLEPAATKAPVETISYEYNGTPQPTTGQKTWVNTTDATQTLDITADRAWVESDVSKVTIISTLDELGAAALETDNFYLEVRETTGATTRLIVTQGQVID